jgi:hypothetical protein
VLHESCCEVTLELEEVFGPEFSFVPFDDFEFFEPLVESLAEFSLLLARF